MKKIHPALTSHFFVTYIIKNATISFIFILVALGIGMLGYRRFEEMAWVDAFVNAAMILSGMGPMGVLKTTGGKIFAGFYALFSGLMFILTLGFILAPVVHRFFLKIHLDYEK